MQAAGRDSAKQASAVLLYKAAWPQSLLNSQEWKGYANNMQRVYTLFLFCAVTSKHHIMVNSRKFTYVFFVFFMRATGRCLVFNQ